MMAKTHSPGFLALVEAAKSRIPELRAEDVVAMVARSEALTLIDVREDSEWNAGHAAGSIHLGKGIIERDVEKLYPDKDAFLVLYCGGGFRSALAADSLREMGYTRAVSMDGGWRGWQAAGGAVETP
jgi:rhodanese-related sulfurtransferase